MAPKEEGAAAPKLEVVKPDAGADLLALGASALAKAKQEIREEVRGEMVKGGLLLGAALFLLLGGSTAKISRSVKRLTR